MKEMQNPKFLHKFRIRRRPPGLVLLLGLLAFLLSIATLSKFSISTLFGKDTFCNQIPTGQIEFASETTKTVKLVITKIHEELNILKDLSAAVADIRNQGKQDPAVKLERTKYRVFLGDILGHLESIQGFLHMYGSQEHEREIESAQLVSRNIQQPVSIREFFLREEIRKYVSAKPNRLGKQNFMGASGTFTSIGHTCFSMKQELEEYMEYDVGDFCKDDWKLGQRLMVHGCDPLPRRRCFSRAPQLYYKPFPINISMWKLPDNRNVRWNQYICKNFTCLANNKTRRGFFKCADCFNLTHHETPRWVNIKNSDSNSSTPDFLISEVLKIKPMEIRIGLDFSIGTGTFAARMREFDVTIVSATINFGAPFNEMIALRGLVPLYLTINQRLPFFDNTLDIIHTTRFLDGWIDFQLLDFILFDWDRVLRPGGLLWIDSFFCMQKDLEDYLESFRQLRYKKHRWVVVPKLDKDGQEVFFSAVLEKPPRPF